MDANALAKTGHCSRGKLQVLCGNANVALTESVCRELNLKRCNAKVGCFSNGEIEIKVFDNVRGDDVFVFQPTCANGEGQNVNQALMELLLIIHTLKLASVRRVVAVIPHYGYSRQDRKTTSRVPISASAVARMITTMGADSVVTLDLHCSQIQGFFHACPVSDLSPSVEFAQYAATKNFYMSQVVVVAPDAGAVNRARRLCDILGASRIVTILKRRAQANVVESMQLVGHVNNAICIIIDDMIDTGGTLCKAAEVLQQHGAKEVHAWATHGILTDPACDRLNKCDALNEVVVTDTIPQQNHLAMCSKLRVISVAKLLADVIIRIHNEQSLEQRMMGRGAGKEEKRSMHTVDGDAFPCGPMSSMRMEECEFDVERDDEREWKNFPK